jgi:hypothetical protein
VIAAFREFNQALTSWALLPPLAVRELLRLFHSHVSLTVATMLAGFAEETHVFPAARTGSYITYKSLYIISG